MPCTLVRVSVRVRVRGRVIPLVAMIWSMYFKPEAVVIVSPVTGTGGSRPSRAAFTISLPSTACVRWVAVRACVCACVVLRRSVRSDGSVRAWVWVGEQSACRHQPLGGRGNAWRDALCDALCRAM